MKFGWKNESDRRKYVAELKFGQKQVGEEGVEPSPPLRGGDFKSPASAIPPLAPWFKFV